MPSDAPPQAQLHDSDEVLPSGPGRGHAGTASASRLHDPQHYNIGIFSIDIRSLAALRIALATIVLLDIFGRVPSVAAHYSDIGVLPRQSLLEIFGSPGIFSAYMLSGRPWIQAGILLVSCIFAISVFIGYRTRFSTAVTWFLLVSLHVRNPVVLQSGDILLALLLFWSFFLPLGAAYSVDRALNTGEEPPLQVRSVASAALMLQVAFVYWFAVLLKIHPTWLYEGSAIYYALNLDQFATPIGIELRNFRWLLRPLTYLTLLVEGAGPFLAFAFYRGPARILVVALMIGMHIAFGLFLALGLFALVSIACWLPFLPTYFWERLSDSTTRQRHTSWAIYYDFDCLFCRKLAALLGVFLALPELKTAPAQSVESIQEEMRRRNSWVVISPAGERYFAFDALVQLFCASVIFRPVGAMLNRAAIIQFGNKLYWWTANHRTLLGRLLAMFKFRTCSWRLPKGGQVAAGFCLLLVFQWNTWPLTEHFQPSKPARAIVSVLNLDQEWTMFAPFPIKKDGWFIAVAELSSGEIVDLITDSEVTWDKPSVVSRHYGGQYWRKYMSNLSMIRYQAHRPLYLDFLCRDWNTNAAEGPSIRSIALYYTLEVTPEPATPIAEPVPTKMLDHSCTNGRVQI